MGRVQQITMEILLILTVVAVVASLLAPEGLEAQSPGSCEVCEDGVGEHRFLWDQGLLCEPEDPDCRACSDQDPYSPDEYMCHNMFLSGSCANLHFPCDPPDFADAREQLLEAIEDRDVLRVTEVLIRHSDSVVLNRDRGAIQWKDCEGALAGHVPIGDGEVFVMQVALSLDAARWMTGAL